MSLYSRSVGVELLEGSYLSVANCLSCSSVLWDESPTSFQPVLRSRSTLGVRKIYLLGIILGTGEPLPMQPQFSQHLLMSKGDNVQEILGAIGQVETKWGSIR